MYTPLRESLGIYFMTDEELKIQLALGSIKWWDLSEEQIENIGDPDTMDFLYNLTCTERVNDVFVLEYAHHAFAAIQRRKIELTGNLL